jgi:cell division protein FtsB
MSRNGARAGNTQPHCQIRADPPSYGRPLRPRSFSRFNTRRREDPIITRRPTVPSGSHSTQRRFAVGIIAAVAGFIAFAIYGQAAQSRDLEARVTTLSQQNAVLHQQITDRRREIVEAQTAAWLIEESRKIGYIFPGETIYVVTPPGTSPPPGGGVNVPLPSFSLPTPTPSPPPPSPTSGTPATPPQVLVIPTPSPH